MAADSPGASFRPFSVSDWPFAWKLRGAVCLLLLTQVNGLLDETRGISARVHETTIRLESVASVAEENAASAQEMVAMTDQLDTLMVTVATLSAGADGAGARSGETLGSLAARLRELVSSFRVEAGEPSQPGVPLEPAAVRTRELAGV